MHTFIPTVSFPLLDSSFTPLVTLRPVVAMADSGPWDRMGNHPSFDGIHPWSPRLKQFVTQLQQLTVVEMLQRRIPVLCLPLSWHTNTQNFVRTLFYREDFALEQVIGLNVFDTLRLKHRFLWCMPNNQQKGSFGVLLTGNEIVAFHWPGMKPLAVIQICFVRRHGLDTEDLLRMRRLIRGEFVLFHTRRVETMIAKTQYRHEQLLLKRVAAKDALQDRMPRDARMLVLEFLGWV